MAWFAGNRITAQKLRDTTPHTVDWAVITANTDPITTETVFLTSSSVVFRTGRAYRISFRGLLQSNGTANNGGRFRLRKTNVSGTMVREWWDVPAFASTSGRNFNVDLSTVATNTTGTDITAALAVSLLRDWGSDNILIAASAGTPASLHIEDIGAAATVAGAQSIT
ncbi:hypothetical protein [Streptomyces odonnellii]|uniref:hypothetical protein n=1 Tax=Streptomyces odonnellii TaxID=1417980 RepID=UPI0006264364|nr:hypothetical protein [Streptomyces odonnellii]